MRTLLNKIRKLLKDRRTRRLWSRTISIVAALVVFVTTYALVLPAITMESQAYCGLEAHQHTDDCFERQLICTIPESPGHHHGDSCYTMRQEYSCTLEEHIHAEGCYDEEGNLICEIPEHTHEEGTCWQEVPELTCTLEESDGHQHGDSCYENVLVCGKEVHTHSEACYENPDEFLETAAVATTQEGAYGISTFEDFESSGIDEGFDGSGTDGSGEPDGSGDEIGWTDSDEYGNAARSDVTDMTASEGENDGTALGGEIDGSAGSQEAADGLTDPANAVNGMAAPGADVAGADVSGSDAAGTDNLSEEAQQDLTSAGINEEENRYVPQLDPLAFDSALRSRTGIYYYHVREGETIEDSSLITEWKKVDKNTELGPNDLLRVYLSYTIPAGSLNETNPTASYRLPANLHLTDDQVNGINAIENGISAAYIDYNTLTVTDPDNYHRYLGAEAVEGTRTPDQTPEEYLAQNAAGQEFISATVRAQNVYDAEGLYGEKGVYLGQDLIFTFSPYTIEKNQHTYDASGQPTRAGEKVRGWFAIDFNLSQVDLDEPCIEEIKNIEKVEVESNNDRENENADEYTGEENTAVSEDGAETTVLISRELRTADIVFVEKDDSRNLDEISTAIKVVTAENYERAEENPDDTENIGNTENSEENGEEQPEESAEGSEENLTGQEAETGEDTTDADSEDKSDADAEDKKDVDQTAEDDKDKDKTGSQGDEPEKTIMPAMSFEDSIRVHTGKPAGVEDGSAGSAAASAAESLPRKAKVTVRVEADEGTFPAGTTMALSAVEDLDAVAETVKETVENGDGDNNGNTTADTENKNPKTYGFQAVDISFQDADGNEIEPAKPVRVALTSEIVEQIKADKETNENTSIADPVVVHLDDDGNAEKMDLIAPEEVEPAQGKTEEELREEQEKAKAEKEEAEKAGQEEPDLTAPDDGISNPDQTTLDNQENAVSEMNDENPAPEDPANTGQSSSEADDQEKAISNDQQPAGGDAPNESGEEPTVFFQTDSFSVYAIVYTVDFHYEVNGKMYQFSLPGGGFVSFTDLVEVLGIIGDTNSEENGDENGSAIAENAEENGINEGAEENGINADTNTVLTLGDVEVSEATKKFVADVASVEFSNPELVDVSKVEEDTTAGQIKESRGLECEYSAELTEDQIVDINAQTVEAGDWALISLQPFKSDESLTVTMKNGDQFVVNVTDAQLKKTVISASGETIEVVVTYDDSAEIPVGATLEITEFAEDSDEYQAAREAVVEKKQSEDPAFDDEEFGVTAFDVSIVDEDGNQVEPKATVDVSMKMKSLPEEAAEENVQYSFEIHHLDESSGEVAVENVASAIDGSIHIEEETAQAEFQLDSFSTFTISWSENTSNTYTTLRWTYTNNWNQTAGRVNVRVNYVDQNGNAISRPSTIGWTEDRWVGDNGEVNVNLEEALAKDISGYTFTRAYISNGGTQSTVTNAVGKTEGGWGWRNNTLRLYDGNSEVYINGNYNNQNSYDAPNNLLYLEYSGGPHTTIHYGYMDGDTFVEFDEQPDPTNTSTSFGWAHLIYDFVGTDDQGLPVDWKYKGTYYHTSETTNPQQGGTTMQPILRYYNNAWRYYNGNISSQNDTRNNSNWKAVADDSDIYVVYEKPVIPMGGTPSPSENSPQPDTPYILKESVSNTDGTNTLSLSVTGSRKPMVTDKVADVIVILDLSSSMRRDIGSQTAYDSNYQTVTNSRYYQAKNAVQKLADALYAVNGTDGEQYRMGLITFSNYAGRTYLSPTENQSTFQSTLDGITAYEGSGTNWEHALQLANQMSVASDRATYIVFITDGEPSVRQTRGNLTNEQLSGANWTNNPAIEGDIFHGGLAGGQFFPNNNDHNTPDFRDYFGSATFGGLMNNDVWDPRNRNAAVDEVASMLGHNKGFYAIGVSSEVNYLGDFAAAAGVDTNHYKLVTSATAFDEVIDDILEELDINGVSGQANIKMFDGITDLTQTISKVNQTEDNRLLGVDGDFKYYKSTAPADWNTWTTAQKAAYALGVEYANSSETPTEYASYTQDEIDAYNLGKSISFTEWTTRATDGCAAAVYNTETGAVEWNMGQKFMLEDGVTYKVSFICWPSQEAYDIIAKLNNGTITFGDTDLYPQEIWDQFEGDITNGYTLKTNAEGANTKYSKATNVNGNVTVGDEQDPLPFQYVPPMPLDKDKLNVAKTWQASRIDSQTPESVILQVVGDDELYKQFEITPTGTVDGSDTPNKGRYENIYISCGHLKVNKDTGEVVIYESGHDFTLREVGENSRHWDLDASICRPMKINMEETMLVLVEEDDIPNAMKTNLNLEYLAENGNEYYRVDGDVYKVDEALTDITGFNTRRSFLDLSKEVLVDNEVWSETVDEVFTYKIKFNIDPTTLSWDPDLEKYIIISTRDANGTVLPSSILTLTDAEYTPTAKLPSACGFEESNNTKYLVAENDVEFYLSIKNGWSVRFLNLPAGTTYSIEEVLPEDSNYDFNNVRLETRKDSSSANPVSTDTYFTVKLDGSIEETSTLYKVVYRNAAITQEVQILKTGQDASTPLGGAKFDLYTEKAYTSNPQEAPFKTDLVSSNEAAAKGKIDLGEIPIGKYYLVETKAPDGYNMRTEPVIITVSKTTVTYDDGTTLSLSGSGISQIGAVYQLKVTNDEGVALPSTGGPGTRLFTILGSILILGAGVLLWRRRRTI